MVHNTCMEDNSRTPFERQMLGKQRMRKRLAALSFSEKIKILEKLRDREKAIAAAGLRRTPSARGEGK